MNKSELQHWMVMVFDDLPSFGSVCRQEGMLGCSFDGCRINSGFLHRRIPVGLI